MEIIFADDDLYGRKIVLKLLAEGDLNIIIAEDGLEAWKFFKSGKARIVITDWVMPGMSGLELCKRIRQEYTDKYIYIIIITAKEEKNDVVEALKAGADDFILKPISVRELSARIRSGVRIINLEDERLKAIAQLHQSEKMASVGQLAAGVAHEINNPTGFVSSNLRTLVDYQKDTTVLIEKYRSLLSLMKDSAVIDSLPSMVQEKISDIVLFEDDVDISYILDDFNELIKESRDGLERIKKIVIDLKDFAHPGEEKMRLADINQCLETTLNVICNEIKYKAVVTKQFGELPQVLCHPQQLNQVFMNMIINAAHAIENQGEIQISTEKVKNGIVVIISDNGRGIEEKNLSRIFDPFYTTKEVGKGTGLGMNVAYNIVKKHNGTIDVESRVGKGTVFTIFIPARQSHSVQKNNNS